MTELFRMWVGILTRNNEDSGTDSEIVLIINQDGIDIVHYNFFPNTQQFDLEEGQANLYTIDVGEIGVDTSRLTDSSIRIEINGEDMWQLEHIIIWGQGSRFPFPIVPVAIATDITSALSEEEDEGLSSIPITLVEAGLSTLEINRLLLVMTTDGVPSGSIFGNFYHPDPAHQTDVEDAGTDSPINLQIVSGGAPLVNFTFPGTPQQDQEAGQANLYFAPVPAPFTKDSLTGTSITLQINGDDMWLPSSFFLFGLDDASGRPERLVPLVHIPSWPFGFMSTDSSEGVPNVNLPLYQEGLGAADRRIAFAEPVIVMSLPSYGLKLVVHQTRPPEQTRKGISKG